MTMRGDRLQLSAKWNAAAHAALNVDDFLDANASADIRPSPLVALPLSGLEPIEANPQVGLLCATLLDVEKLVSARRHQRRRSPK
jgi:hypothetical protein